MIACFDIQFDGTTVWVHSDEGHTVARFGSMGIDIHLPDSSGCLECTHGPTDRRDWDRFVAGVARHHGCDVSAKSMPDRFR